MANVIVKTVAGMGGLGILAIGGWHWATQWRPSSDLYPLQGIDLMQDPPVVDWGSVRAAGADFAYLVATSGRDRREPSFEANWEALPAAGLRRGAVHLYSMCQPAIDQADAFNTVVPATPDALPAAVDLDYRGDCAARPRSAPLIHDLRQFVARVEGHTGKPMLLRISRAVESDYQISTAVPGSLWVIATILRPGYAARPWKMWRASDIRRVDGIEQPVNWDVVAP